MTEQVFASRKINGARMTGLIIGLFVSVFCIADTIYIAVTGDDPYNNFTAIICGIVMGVLPFLLEIAIKRKLSDYTLLFYMIFLFFALFLGYVLGFYLKYIIYDKIMHSIFGYVGCVGGLILVCQLSDYKQMRPLFVAIICLAISMGCGAIWEIVEFSTDMLLDQTAQGARILLADGTFVTNVKDTMMDLICNFFGAIVFVLHYAVHRLSKRNLLMDSMATDFSSMSRKNYN